MFQVIRVHALATRAACVQRMREAHLTKLVAHSETTQMVLLFVKSTLDRWRANAVMACIQSDELVVSPVAPDPEISRLEKLLHEEQIRRQKAEDLLADAEVASILNTSQGEISSLDAELSEERSLRVAAEHAAEGLKQQVQQVYIEYVLLCVA